MVFDVLHRQHIEFRNHVRSALMSFFPDSISVFISNEYRTNAWRIEGYFLFFGRLFISEASFMTQSEYLVSLQKVILFTFSAFLKFSDYLQLPRQEY